MDAAFPPAVAGAGSMRIGRVALAVRDLGAVLAFYRDVVGLRVLRRDDDRVGLGVDGAVLLDLLSRPDALPDDPAAAGLFHTAFLLPTRADLGRWLARAPALDGAADHLVSEAVYLHDPEGNGVEIYADRPRDAWRWQNGRVEMANRPLDAPGLLRAGAGSDWNGAPPGTRVGHVHLRVGDVAEAVRFYNGVLGLDVTAGWGEAAFLSAGGYHHHLAANVWRSAGAGPRDPGRAGLVSVCLAGADLSAIAARAALSNPGLSNPGLSGPGDLLRDGLHDPWGTWLRFQPAS